MKSTGIILRTEHISIVFQRKLHQSPLTNVSQCIEFLPTLQYLINYYYSNSLIIYFQYLLIYKLVHNLISLTVHSSVEAPSFQNNPVIGCKLVTANLRFKFTGILFYQVYSNRI